MPTRASSRRSCRSRISLSARGPTLSSTIEEQPPETPALRHEAGQILVLFAGGMIAFLLVAALVFDVGQNLVMWRVQAGAPHPPGPAPAPPLPQPGRPP